MCVVRVVLPIRTLAASKTVTWNEVLFAMTSNPIAVTAGAENVRSTSSSPLPDSIVDVTWGKVQPTSPGLPGFRM